MNDTNVTTGEARLSYVHLFQPYSQTGKDEDAKYSVTVLLPKTDTATKARIDAAVEFAKQIGTKEKWDGIAPPMVPVPIHDGDGVRPDGTPFTPECKGHWVFTARTSNPVEVVDERCNPIIDQTQVYSGMYGKVNFTAFAYKFAGKKGIGFGLGPVMKTRDGEPLGGGGITAAQAFGAPQPAPAASFGVDPITGLPLGQ